MVLVYVELKIDLALGGAQDSELSRHISRELATAQMQVASTCFDNSLPRSQKESVPGVVEKLVDFGCWRWTSYLGSKPESAMNDRITWSSCQFITPKSAYTIDVLL